MRIHPKIFVLGCCRRVVLYLSAPLPRCFPTFWLLPELFRPWPLGVNLFPATSLNCRATVLSPLLPSQSISIRTPLMVSLVSMSLLISQTEVPIIGHTMFTTHYYPEIFIYNSSDKTSNRLISAPSSPTKTVRRRRSTITQLACAIAEQVR